MTAEEYARLLNEAHKTLMESMEVKRPIPYTIYPEPDKEGHVWIKCEKRLFDPSDILKMRRG